jgi:hypothetical protein
MSAAASIPSSIPVTIDTFARAETDLYFSNFVRDGGIGKLFHTREPTPLDQQKIIRMNRDTLYSSAVFDLDAGPVTITMPDPGGRFMSLQVWDEDEYCPLVAYGSGRHIFTREKIGTRYIGVGVRTLVDPTNPDDIRTVHWLQDAVRVEQQAPGTFEIPNWDPITQTRVREALEQLGHAMPDSRRTFGPKGQVDPVRHLIGAAVGWGGNPEQDAFYVNISPTTNDGRIVHLLHVPADVPVDGFWSVSVYNAEGYFEPNPSNAYSVNNMSAVRNADGSVEIQFGGCDGSVANCLPVTPGWTAAVRLYRPRPEILSGSWKFPDLHAIH